MEGPLIKRVRWRRSARVAKWAASMARPKRSNDWGFPRWRAYGAARDARAGAPLRPPRLRGARRPARAEIAEQPGALVFLRAPRRRIQSQLELFRRAERRGRGRARSDEQRDASAFRQANHYGWGGPGDGSRSRDEMRALDVLELETDADFEEIKAAYRRLAKANHPDVKPGDRDAAAALPDDPGELRRAAPGRGTTREPCAVNSSPAFAGEGDRTKCGGGASSGVKRPLHHASHGPPPLENEGRTYSVNMNVPVTLATGSSASPSWARPRTKPTLLVTP